MVDQLNAPLEKDVQKSVADYLNTLGLSWFAIPNQRLLWSSTDNETSHAVYKSLIDQGMKPGVPDILVLNRPPQRPECKGLALELKRADGHKSDLTQNQQEWLRSFQNRGWMIGIAFGLDEAMQWIDEKAGYV